MTNGQTPTREELARRLAEAERTIETLRAFRSDAEAQRDFQRAQALAHTGSWRFDLNTGSVIASGEARRIYGLGYDEWSISRVQALPLPEYRAALDQALRDLIAHRAPYDIEFEIRRPTDHAIRHIHSVAEYDPARRIVIGTIQDITERKLAEEALRNSETLLAHSQQIAHVGSWMLDAASGRLTWSDETRRIFGVGEDFEPGYEAFLNAVHPDDRAAVDAAFSAAERAGDSSYQIEHRIVRPSTGEVRDVMERCVFERDSSGALVRAIGMVQDITERKLTERGLRQFKTMFDTANFGATVSALDGTMSYVNTRFAADHGYTPEELVGQPMNLLLDMTHREGVQRLSDQLRAEASTGPTEVWHRHRDGTVFPMLMTAFAIRDSNGQPESFVATGIDIRAQKALEAQLAQAQKMESVGRLAGGVAHDFNNMLGVILGYTELAMDAVAVGDHVRDYLKEINAAARRSADVAQQLLAFARKQTIAPRLIDLNDMVEGMLKMLRRLIGEDIDLTWAPETTPWHVLMDPSQVHQVLVNLCVNARDAIAGVGKITIETGTLAADAAFCAGHPGLVAGDYVTLAVTDNGCGMDRETLDNLFEPFFTTKDGDKGTGLGLATVYGIVTQNKGGIDVVSAVGHGTTFRIYLPAHKLAAPRATIEESTAPPRARAGDTVLIVEDEAAILKLAATLLQMLGYTVLTAGSPGDALELVRTHAGPIHVLLTDVIMPEMNGRELARQLQVLHPGVRTLFMSGYTANAIAHHGVLDDGVLFIQKPFTAKDIAVKVRQALGE